MILIEEGLYIGSSKMKTEMAIYGKRQIIKSFVGSRGGFSKEPLAAGGTHESKSIG
jgi:hypothetical protein